MILPRTLVNKRFLGVSTPPSARASGRQDAPVSRVVGGEQLPRGLGGERTPEVEPLRKLAAHLPQ